MTKERFRIVNDLWTAGIKAEVLYNDNPRMDKQMDYAVDHRVPFIIFIGENEVKENKIKVKCMANSSEVLLTRDNYIEELLKLRLDEKLLIIENKSQKNK
jgi:histidyl-tRNA synthetase